MPQSPSPRVGELVMPAGSLRNLETAVLYGADAVYAGTPDLSLRTRSTFSVDDLARGVAFAHERGVRVYLTLNLFAHNRDIERLPEFVDTLRLIRPDGVIVSDPGVFRYLAEHAPELELHVSTQANVTNWLTAKHWREQGAALCVLAREISFDELAEIRHRCPDLRLETFVHGAMCMTYSGRCLLSNYMAERGSNQGSCAHSCRWKYQLTVKHADGSTGTIEIDDQNRSEFEFFLTEQFRPDEQYPIVEDEHGSYILNSRDLCLMPKLADYLALGVDSLKVEGRSKNEYYVAVVARAYRAAIDAWRRDPEAFDPAPFMAELQTTRSRGYTLGFHDGRLGNLGHNYDDGQTLSGFEFGGFIRQWQGHDMIFEVRNRLLPGDVIELLVPSTLDVIRLRLYEFENADTGATTDRVSAGEGRAIRIAASNFRGMDANTLAQLLPKGSVGRKCAPLDADRLRQLDHNVTSFSVEQGLVDARTLRREVPPSQWKNGSGKAPRLGADGCCGLGCNGCLPFWNDARYATARQRLRRQTDGLKLRAETRP